MSTHVVVVGNGMVGHHFAQQLLRRDTDDAFSVTVLGEEQHPAYDRVALSSYVTHKSVGELELAWDVDAADPRLRVHRGHAVESIDPEARSLCTTAGEQFSYDVLVLATGSRAFVPPVAGHDARGCFVYRTIDDLDAIEAAAGNARRAIVVGGGLLGLEAADAMRAFGLAATIVEAAPRLMPVQIDEAGGQCLLRHVKKLGIEVVLGRGVDRVVVDDDGRAVGLSFADGEVLAADLVVFAAGIRARDELARAAGLPVGDRGGVLVDRHCRTSYPDIFAIGEVAAVEGITYGLVAPGYAMSDMLVDVLLKGAEDTAQLQPPDMSTKLKLLGVDVASFGDAHGTTENAISLAWTDPLNGVYKKLVVTDDASTVLGGVLVGDAASYSTLRALVGKPLELSPEQLIAPTSTADLSLALPPDAQVCSCHAVTKASICEAIATGDCSDVPSVKACTKAGTGCGSCVPLIGQLLTESGVEVSRSLCEHFAHSRPELFEILRLSGIRTFSELIGSHGSGGGCDICKPAVASMFASLGHGHVLDRDRRPLQDTNDRYLANIQRDGTYSVIPRIPGGEITPDKLIVIGQVAKDFGLYTKITGGQRIDLLGARLEQLPAIWARLVGAGFESGHAYGKALRTVKSCVGSTWCRFGVQDSVGLAIMLELRYRGLRAPHKIKAGVSGCARECAEARGKDFGIIATEAGWNLYLGGNGGFTPRHAMLFESDVDTETLITYIDRFLMYYIRTADRLQRTAPWIESLDGGIDHVREVIVNDSLGVCEELDAAMAAHIENYTDEWAATLADPEKLRQFVSFVNAPAMADPDISFVAERDQHRPAGNPETVVVAGPKLEVVRS